MGAEEGMIEALRPIVEARGLELWDVERSGISLCVLVDRPGGVDLDGLADLSNLISAFLDERDDLVPAGHYQLDVSSPGVERRLRRPSHFETCRGQEVAIKTSVAIDGARRLQGVLTGSTESEVTIRVTKEPGEVAETKVPLSSIERAHTIFTWGPPTKAAKATRSHKKTGKSERPRPASVGVVPTTTAKEAG